MLRPTHPRTKSAHGRVTCSGQVASVLLRIWPKKNKLKYFQELRKFPRCQSSCKAPMHWGFFLQETCLSLTAPLSDPQILCQRVTISQRKQKTLICISIFQSWGHSTGSEVRFRYQEATCTFAQWPIGPGTCALLWNCKAYCQGIAGFWDALFWLGLRWHTDPKPTEEWHSIGLHPVTTK